MSAVRVGTFEPGSAEWHAARARGIGASEIAAVVGLSPWESRFSLWHRKAGSVPAQMDEELLRWGRALEEPIARRFAQENPHLRVRRTGTWCSSERPWQLANPDRLIPGRRPVEIKWSPRGDGWGAPGTNEIPVYYRCQLLWQMDVLDADYGFLAALVDTEYREYFLERDADAEVDIALMRAEAATFVASLPTDEDDGQPPALDGSEHTYRAVRALHPDIDPREQEIPSPLADAYRAVCAASKTAATVERHVKGLLLTAMGDARRAVRADGERVAIRSPHHSGSVQLRETAPPKTPITSVKEAISA